MKIYNSLNFVCSEYVSVFSKSDLLLYLYDDESITQYAKTHDYYDYYNYYMYNINWDGFDVFTVFTILSCEK